MDESNTPRNRSHLARILAVLFGSGLFLSALHMFGRVFYEGYLHAFGFDLALFPVSREGSFLWAYSASLYTGVGAITLWSKYFLLLLLAAFFSVPIAYVIWKLVVLQPSDFHLGGESHPAWKKLIYYSLLSIWFVPAVVLVSAAWIGVPFGAYKFGEQMAINKITTYEENLCISSQSSWDWCIEVDHEQGPLRGRLILANDMLLGVFTEEGPVTVSRPENFYSLRTKTEQ